jgi:hypothetical protein
MTHMSSSRQAVSDQENDRVRRLTWAFETSAAVRQPVDTVLPVILDVREGLMEGQELELGIAESQRDQEDCERDVRISDRVQPFKEAVRGLSGSTQAFSTYTGFYLWKVSEVGSSTNVSIETYGEGEFITPMSPKDAAEFEEAQRNEWFRCWGAALASLRCELEET